MSNSECTKGAIGLESLVELLVRGFHNFLLISGLKLGTFINVTCFSKKALTVGYPSVILFIITVLKAVGLAKVGYMHKIQAIQAASAQNSYSTAGIIVTHLASLPK